MNDNVVNAALAVLGYLAREAVSRVKRISNRRKKIFTYEDVHNGLDAITPAIKEQMQKPDMILGLGRGGSIVAGILGHLLGDQKGPCAIHTWNLDGHGDQKRIYPTPCNIAGKKVLLVTAEDFTGRTLSKAVAFVNNADNQHSTSPELLRTLSFYSLNYKVREHLTSPIRHECDFYPLPNYICRRVNDGTEWTMPWESLKPDSSR